MGFFDLFTMGWRRELSGLRKRYDRTRERADRMAESARRMAVLQVLDQVEPTLIMLEEQRISRYDRPRFVNYVKTGIEQARMIEKQKNYIPQPTSTAPTIR